MDEKERLAVMEVEVQHSKESISGLRRDIRELIAFVKAHMAKEEEDREALLDRLVGIENAQSKMSGFRAGVAAAVTLLWTLVGGVLYFFGKGST